MSNFELLASGLVVLLCAVLVIARAMTRFSSTSVREDLTVSRAWLLENRARNKSD
jgi:hypothetical protein